MAQDAFDASQERLHAGTPSAPSWWASALTPIQATVEDPSDLSTLTAQHLAALFRGHLVHGGTVRRERHAVGLARRRGRHLAVEDVGQHEVVIAVQRVPIPCAAG